MNLSLPVVDANEGIDEGNDSVAIDRIQSVNTFPGRKSDRGLHIRVRRDESLIVCFSDIGQLIRECVAIPVVNLAIVLQEDATMLHLMNLDLECKRICKYPTLSADLNMRT